MSAKTVLVVRASRNMPVAPGGCDDVHADHCFGGHEQVRIRGLWPAALPEFQPGHHVVVGEVGEPVGGSGDADPPP
ncbi:hypothetical protein [Nocardia sp. NPDC057440]|uniref:hypothetical protein n=1 Tax=Nocardia sp. NPDC057440 TaxID=3346134 RepID=UPI0036734248